MAMRDGNVAFKVTYTDSNWSGVCSPELAARNFKKKYWCKHQAGRTINCQHPQFSNPNDLLVKGYPCSDSVAQLGLLFYPGHYHSEEKDNEPKKAHQIKMNKIAVFTSKEPHTDESTRFIFAIGLIDNIEIMEDVNGNYEVYKCDPESAIIFKNRRPEFWKYYTNENAPDRAAWNSLLFRYLDDDLVIQILSDIVFKNMYPRKFREKAKNLLGYVKS